MIVEVGKYGSFVQWELLHRSQAIDPQFHDFEREVGVTFPDSFKRWHSRYFTLDGGIGGHGAISGIDLPAIPSNDLFGPLREQMFEIYLPEPLRRRGFVPFASAWDTGPLCFDTTAQVPDADWPIYIWDHEDEQDVQLVFSSFRKLLECCVHNCGGIMPDYGPLPEDVDGLKSIDPNGIGLYYDMMEGRKEALLKKRSGNI